MKKMTYALGSNFEEIHKKYVHTIGNLTLTGYNSTLSNKSFVEKRDMKNGFKESRLKLNKYLSSIDKWNEEELLNRTNILFNLALEIWAYPTTKFVEEIITGNMYSLNDEEDFTNTN
jgi:hypothetical protein